MQLMSYVDIRRCLPTTKLDWEKQAVSTTFSQACWFFELCVDSSRDALTVRLNMAMPKTTVPALLIRFYDHFIPETLIIRRRSQAYRRACYIQIELERHFDRVTYPLSTPSTRLSMKNDPMTMRGTKYTQLYELPRASLVWNWQNIIGISWSVDKDSIHYLKK